MAQVMGGATSQVMPKVTRHAFEDFVHMGIGLVDLRKNGQPTRNLDKTGMPHC